MSRLDAAAGSATALLARPGSEDSATAAALSAAGVRPHHRVALYADNSAAYLRVLLGLMHLSAGIVLIDRGRSARSAEHTAVQAGADWLIQDSGSLPDGPVPLLDLDTLTADHDAGPGRWDGRGNAPLGLDAWERRGDALITCSSGSTGEPKMIVRSGASVLANTRRSARRMGYRESDVLAPLLPFSHQYGFSLVLLAWMARCSLLLTPYRRLDRALRLLGEHGATAVDATPSTYRSMLRLLDRRPDLVRRTHPVRMWCVGGAPLDDRLALDFRTAMGAPLLDGYGTSELGNIALAAPEDPELCLPLDGVEVAVRDERGRDLPAGRPGEVWVRTPDVMSGYLPAGGGPPAPLEPGDYRTHDLGVLDGRGSLRVLGRMSALTRHGYTLYPAHLARKAEQCGRPVHVVPVEDERGGARLVYLVEDPGRGSSSAWHTRFAQVLEHYELPNQIVVMDSFPVTGKGKTDLPSLEERARREFDQGRRA
ncbi:class I adenylate-forming enzyme family protein [Streptomyces prasinopilosus]|uniref:Acyl-CoA synthetase (AMP-forming)/AMP-acid ligase II n=2 Tax=Streptomyces prasinopilosus TaxID=67344 RepID=A0A1G7AN38_9ACTN|nr:class I adenylate-forming enzyme family protein [Streptomyces prasinopilosus]SDE15877.1 Acyl-CoA synthetase (AMP-forming)/AMP-acid ligase II [Streptomyces prasinopilosus]